MAVSWFACWAKEETVLLQYNYVLRVEVTNADAHTLFARLD
jgi:hypothetical protein